jgi:recombination protein RecT
MSNEMVKSKATEVRALLSSDAMKTQIAKALPAICTPDRFMRIAVTAITKNPKLAECTQESLMGCLLDLAQLGIEADGRRAHLIPYGNTCTLILDYKGLVELVKRGGEVVTIHADKVCKNDDFLVDMGEIKKHLIDYSRDRGEAYAYYAYAKMKDGSLQTEVMTKAEVEKIRQGSKGKNSSPWTQHFDEMGKKTVFRRLAKWLPMLPEVAQKVDQVERMEFDFEMPKKEANFKSADDINVEG